MSIETVANWIGAGVMASGGLVLVAGLLAAASVAVGVAGAWLWNRLRRIYHLTVIWYWLERLEKEGTHCFQKADGAAAQEAQP